MTTNDENYVTGSIDYEWCEDNSSTGVVTPQTPQVSYFHCYLKPHLDSNMRYSMCSQI